MSENSLATESRPLIARDSSGGKFVISEMEVQEGISQLFNVNLTIISNQFKEDSNIGKKMTVVYQPGIGQSREQKFLFNGLITAITAISSPGSKENAVWRIELSPWIALLGMRMQCRIFQNMDIKQIIQSLCSDYSIDTPVKFETSESLSSRPFCVQYNESDLDFMNRLLAEEGLHYHFRHSDGDHSMIVGSDNQVFQTCDQSDLEYVTSASDKIMGIRQWHPLKATHQQDSTAIGYSREQATPVSSRSAKSANSAGQSTASGSTEWQSRLIEQSFADKQALSVINHGDSQSQRVSVQSSLPALVSGKRFKLKSHPDSSQQGEYYVDQTLHLFKSNEKSRAREYHNEIICRKVDYPFRAKLVPKPKVHGVQTATVSGPDNQEIYTDGTGCIKVRFHWDTSDTKGDNCSAWVPVVQPLAGKGFGASILPRIGQEVVISFVDGDPDQPLVTGCLYNGKNETPYTDGNIMGLKTVSMTGGSEGHEVRLTDKKDSEEFFVHSQKDLLLDVANDMTSTITGNLTETIEKDHKIEIKQNHSLKTDQDCTLESGQNLTAKSSQNCNLEGGQATSLKSGTDLKVKAGTSASYESTSDTKISGAKVSIEGQAGISLKCGGSEISINPSGITIKAPMVTIEAQAVLSLKGLTAELKGTTQTALSGLIVDVNANTCLSLKGSAMVMIQGGLAKIN